MADVALTAGHGEAARPYAAGSSQLKARRRRETIFIVLGLASTLVGLVTLALLLIDLAAAGLPRLSWEFFTSFPSRRAGQAGSLRAWSVCRLASERASTSRNTPRGTG
jgi:hypothetical protein